MADLGKQRNVLIKPEPILLPLLRIPHKYRVQKLFFLILKSPFPRNPSDCMLRPYES